MVYRPEQSERLLDILEPRLLTVSARFGIPYIRPVLTAEIQALMRKDFDAFEAWYLDQALGQFIRLCSGALWY